MSDVILPIVDLDVFISNPDSEVSVKECKKVCHALATNVFAPRLTPVWYS